MAKTLPYISITTILHLKMLLKSKPENKFAAESRFFSRREPDEKHTTATSIEALKKVFRELIKYSMSFRFLGFVRRGLLEPGFSHQYSGSTLSRYANTECKQR